MRFAQWVLNQIAEHGYKVSNSYDEVYYVNHDREFMTGGWHDFACVARETTDWNLYIQDGWIFNDVKLFRGPEYHKIVLTKEEYKAFLQFERDRNNRIKAENKRAAEEKAKRCIAAQDWP